MATRVAAAGGGNWTAGATWVGGVAPTAADDAQLNGTSGAVTIDAGAVARSLDCTGYTNTLTHTAAVTLTLGDATAGLGNIALKLVAGMTYTLGNVATSAITFASTSATVQTVDCGGKSVGNVTFGTSGTPSYAVTSAMACDATATITSTFGNLQFDGASNNLGLSHAIGRFVASASNVRTLNLGTATITLNGTGIYWTMGTSANITLSAANSTIISTGGVGVGGTTVTFTSGNKSYGTLVIQGASEGSIGVSSSNTATFVNIERVGPSNVASRNGVQLNLAANATIKITGTFKVWGDDATKRALVWPASNAVAGVLDITGATLDFKCVDFQDVVFQTGGANLDLSGITGGSGDAGGNSMLGGGTLTFTPATTQRWLTTGGGNVSDATKWTSRIPLPQDTVIFDTAFTASPTVVTDMIFSLGAVDFSASTGNVTWQALYQGMNTVGNVVLRSGVTLTNGAGGSFYWNSRSLNTTFTFNGATVTAVCQVSSGNGGNLTFTDSGNFGAALQHRSGQITIPAGVVFGSDTYVSNANDVLARCVVNVYGTWQLRSTGTVFSMVNAANLTSIVDYGGQIRLTSTAATQKTFAGGGNTYPALTVAPNGSGVFNITGANTFPRIPFVYSPGTATITLVAGTTTTIRSPGADDFANGTSVVTIRSATGGSPATISKASGLVRGDYLSLQDLTATGGAVFNAGPLTNSTNVSGNTGWTFTAAAGWVPQALVAA